MSEEEPEVKIEEALTEQMADDGLVLNDIQQVFNNEGMMELTADRSHRLISDVLGLLAKNGISNTVVVRGLKSEQMHGESPTAPPAIFFVGEEVNIRFVVPPTDRFMNSGKKWITKEEYNDIRSRQEVELKEESE